METYIIFTKSFEISWTGGQASASDGEVGNNYIREGWSVVCPITQNEQRQFKTLYNSMPLYNSGWKSTWCLMQWLHSLVMTVIPVNEDWTGLDNGSERWLHCFICKQIVLRKKSGALKLWIEKIWVMFLGSFGLQGLDYFLTFKSYQNIWGEYYINKTQNIMKLDETYGGKKLKEQLKKNCKGVIDRNLVIYDM